MGKTDGKSKDRPSDIFRKVRLGAARQHLDYVLIYEVFSETKTTKLASSVANWTIIGGYFVPSREIETSGFANALLLDVRNGYPYGSGKCHIQVPLNFPQVRPIVTNQETWLTKIRSLQ
jgi:hypothetical protein